MDLAGVGYENKDDGLGDVFDEARSREETREQKKGFRAMQAIMGEDAAHAAADKLDEAASKNKKKKKKKAKEGEDGEGEEGLPSYLFDEGDEEDPKDAAKEKKLLRMNSDGGLRKLKDPFERIGKGMVAKIKEQIDKASQQLFKYGPPYYEMPELQADLLEAFRGKHVSATDVHDLLLSQIDPNCHNAEDFGNTPLHYCLRYVSMKGMKLLLKAGMNINITNELQMTAINYALLYVPEDDKKHEKFKCIEYLLKKGANPNTGDKGGHTPLELAASKGNMEMVSLLLSYGARVRRDYRQLNLVDPSAVDAAAADPPELRLLLQSKLEEELKDEIAEDKRKKAQAKADHEEALLLGARRSRQDAQRRKRQARADLAQRKHSEEERRRAEAVRRKQKLLEARARELKMKNKPAPGIWERKDIGRWNFRMGVTAKAMQESSVLEQAKVLKAEMDRPGKGEIVAERWRYMTGRDLLPIGAPPASDDEAALSDASSDLEDDDPGGGGGGVDDLSLSEVDLPPSPAAAAAAGPRAWCPT
mmetsp:Transcript_10353/g.15976  ORF Transcript_10353/g.15976 Transcript_10353/m.15976 type:complete len:532 (+) Transcript_10353:168-1763(+)